MKTEIQGDFRGYVTRFKLPSARCFKLPLRSALAAFLIQLVSVGLLALVSLSPATAIIVLLESLLMVGYYVKVLYKDFWNVVLEESKGLFADMLMWLYYFVVCTVTFVPSVFFFYLYDRIA